MQAQQLQQGLHPTFPQSVGEASSLFHSPQLLQITHSAGFPRTHPEAGGQGQKGSQQESLPSSWVQPEPLGATGSSLPATETGSSFVQKKTLPLSRPI